MWILCGITAGFPIRIRLVWRYFGQNGQKVDENYQINIFGAKQWREHGRGKPIFRVVEETLPSPLTRGNPAQRTEEPIM